MRRRYKEFFIKVMFTLSDRTLVPKLRHKTVLCSHTWQTIGALSKDDDDGSENVGKMEATFPRVEYSSSKEKEKLVVRSTSSIKRQIKRFHVVVVQWTSKKCTKKRDARAELLF